MTLNEHIDVFIVVKRLRAHKFDFGLVVFLDIVNTILFGDCFFCKDIIEVSPAGNGLLLLLCLFLFDVEFLLLLRILLLVLLFLLLIGCCLLGLRNPWLRLGLWNDAVKVLVWVFLKGWRLLLRICLERRFRVCLWWWSDDRILGELRLRLTKFNHVGCLCFHTLARVGAVVIVKIICWRNIVLGVADPAKPNEPSILHLIF